MSTRLTLAFLALAIVGGTAAAQPGYAEVIPLPTVPTVPTATPFAEPSPIPVVAIPTADKPKEEKKIEPKADDKPKVDDKPKDAKPGDKLPPDVKKAVDEYIKEKDDKKKAEEAAKKASDDLKKAEEAAKKAAEPPKEKKWYEKINLRGYTQFRHSELMWESSDGAAATLVADRSVGNNQNFLIRRARIILFGDISENLFIYFQPDFAATPTGSIDQTHFPQLRDWYGDVYLTKDKVHRIRIGQSKVPFGFENMQSSQNRLALDRTDAINSAVSRNERDLGAFYYWTPEHYQALFKRLVDDGLKGSGNYGIFGVGVYNGQGGSFLEQNENLHAVVRGTYPIEFNNGQILELSAQAYTGKQTVLSSPIRPLGTGASYRPLNTLETGGTGGLTDERFGWSAIWYPQPFGFQAEWNVGRGPGLSDDQRAVVVRDLSGGYLQAMYKLDTCRHGSFIPFVQWTHYEGGYRSERNAPFVNISEWHFGCEWQIQKALEFTVQYTLTDRTSTTAFDIAGRRSYRQSEFGALRFQFQINY